MKKMWVTIVVVTLFAVFYQLTPYIGIPGSAIFAMFLISPFLVGYMAYVILKYGKPSGNTFSDRFYDDIDNG